MQADYWNVTNEQVIEKTGKSLNDWQQILDRFGAARRKTAIEVVDFLQSEHHISRFWARTLTTHYLKQVAVPL